MQRTRAARFPWRRAIEITGAELHFIEDPFSAGVFMCEKTATEVWVSATDMLVPPRGLC